MRLSEPEQDRRPQAPEAGFSLLELLIGSGLLAIALLGHTASIFSEHRLSVTQRARSTAILAAEQFVERLRSDDDWAGLYARLRAQKLLALQPGGTVHLADGRRAFVPQAYYDDYGTLSDLGEFHVLVDVPTLPDSSGTATVLTLREDAPLPDFALPADLDGDGAIDDSSHADDYRALPVIITFRWTPGSEAPEELKISTWLWGYR